MKPIIMLLFLLITQAKADFLCDMEYQKVGCKKEDAQCLVTQLSRIEAKCHPEVSELLLKSAEKDPCYKFVQKCGLNVNEECLKDSPPECQKAILDNDKSSKLLAKECDFEVLEKNCPLDRSSGGLGNIQKQMACFNEHKHKLGASCLNLLEQVGK